MTTKRADRSRVLLCTLLLATSTTFVLAASFGCATPLPPKQLVSIPIDATTDPAMADGDMNTVGVVTYEKEKTKYRNWPYGDPQDPEYRPDLSFYRFVKVSLEKPMQVEVMEIFFDHPSTVSVVFRVYVPKTLDRKGLSRITHSFLGDVTREVLTNPYRVGNRFRVPIRKRTDRIYIQFYWVGVQSDQPVDGGRKITWLIEPARIREITLYGVVQ